MEAIPYIGFGLLVTATVASAIMALPLLHSLRRSIEEHDPRYGAELFKFGFPISGFLPYYILGFRTLTLWFTRNGANPLVLEKEREARYPVCWFIGLSLTLVVSLASWMFLG